MNENDTGKATEQQEELQELRRRLAPEGWLDGNIASLSSRRAIWDPAVAVASRSVPILLMGEQGLALDELAVALHCMSGRRGAAVLVDCSLLPVDQQTDELFGASGVVERAQAGTLVVAHVEALGMDAQGRLLQLAEQSAPALGEAPRLVALSEGGLGEAARDGRFSGQLFALLSKNVIGVPPLRDRRAELPILAERVLSQAAARLGSSARRLSEDAAALVASHDFPENILELRALMESAALACREEVVQPAHLPEQLKLGLRAAQAGASGALAAGASTRQTGTIPYRDAKEAAVREFERSYFQTLLAKTGNNVSEAARQAGLDRSNFRRALRRAGLRSKKEANNPGLAKPSPPPEPVADEPAPRDQAVGERG